MKKVLIIVHDFPPAGGIAVRRVLGHVKYLPEYGWDPVVMTVVEGYSSHYDPSTLSEVPKSIHVIRTPTWERKRRLKLHLQAHEHVTMPYATLQSVIRIATASTVKSLKRFITSQIFIPDRKVGWLPFAFSKGTDIIKHGSIDIVLTTSPPETTHLIGYYLKKRYGKPWIADFRDGWVECPLAPPTPRLSKKIQMFMEKKVLEAADGIVTASESITRDFQVRYPSLDDSKIITITNGFDEDLFSDIRSKNSTTNRFTISYIGGFPYGQRTADYFLQAVARLLKEQPLLREKIQLVFVGTNFQQDSLQLMEQLKITDVVTRVPYVEYKRALQYMIDADILLLLIASGNHNVNDLPGKFFEYLAARRPILALAPEGETARLIQTIGAGIVVPPKDIDSIKSAIFSLYNRHVKGNYTLNSVTSKDLERFSRKVLTKELSRILNCQICS